MTATLADLLHLVDRAERRVLLPEEAGLLRAGIQALAGAGDSRSDPSEAENALRGGSPGLAASARPSLPPGP